MDDEPKGPAVWLNTEAWLRKNRDDASHAPIIAFDLVMMFCAHGQPLDVSDEKKLLAAYAKTFPNRPPSLRKWRKLRPQIKEFFVEVRPDLWSPSPEYFVFNDPISEGALDHVDPA